MDYIPGCLHEKLQREHFFLINRNFSWINCRDKRFKDMNGSKDWGELDIIGLIEGDVVVIRFFKPSSVMYSYLERVICNNGDINEYKKESIVSGDFIERNSGTVKNIFTDVTKSFDRDKKIEILI